MRQFVEDFIGHLGVRRYLEPSDVGIARATAVGYTRLARGRHSGPLEYHEAPGSTALFVSGGFERICRGQIRKCARNVPREFLLGTSGPFGIFKKSVRYVFSVSDLFESHQVHQNIPQHFKNLAAGRVSALLDDALGEVQMRSTQRPRRHIPLVGMDRR